MPRRHYVQWTNPGHISILAAPQAVIPSGYLDLIALGEKIFPSQLAQQLIGVTMHEPGVSRLVAVDVEEAVRMAAM